MIEIRNKDEMKKYYVEENNTYVFDDEVFFLFNVNVEAHINAHNINAENINAYDIKAWHITAGNINANDIKALNIYANNITYYAVCVANNDIECNSIKGRHTNAKHFVLDGELIIKGEEKITSKEVLEKFELKKEEVECCIKEPTCEAKPDYDSLMQQNEKLIKENNKLKIIVDMLLEKEMKHRGDLL